MNRTTTMKHILPFFFALLISSSALAQTDTITVKGVVTDEKGEELIGILVQEKGTANHSIGDFDGKYSINVPKDAILVFSYLGCKTQEIQVQGRTEINVIMEEENYILDEPVYYYHYTDNQLNYDTSDAKTRYVSAPYFGRPNSEESIIQGNLSGVYSNPGERANMSSILIRGGNVADGKVKYVVDEIPDAPFDPSTIRYGFATKDVTSSSIFGTTAASGGVMHLQSNDNYFNNNLVLNANAWMGVQEVSHLLPDNDKDLFDKDFQEGLVQHYDLTLGKKFRRIKLTGTASFDNIEGAIKSTRAENLTTSLKGDVEIFHWLYAKQNLYYKHSRESFGIINSEYPDIPITNYKPEETLYSATSLEGRTKRNLLNFKTLFTYKRIDSKISYNDLNPAIFRKIVWDNTVAFDKQWNRHRLRVLGGYTYNNRKYKLEAENKTTPELITNDLLLRAAYNYKDGIRSLIANIRRSSTSEHVSKDYAYFPAVSASWNIAKENFAYDWFWDHKIATLRLRTSWGKIGSIGFDSWDDNPDRMYGYYNLPFSFSDLKWQTTEQWNVGLDLEFINYLSFTVNYFDKKTNNAPCFPYESEIIDYAKITNRGWEFEASYNHSFNYQSFLRLKANLTLYNSSVEKNNEESFLFAGNYLAPDNFYGFEANYEWKKFNISALMQGATNAKFTSRSYAHPPIKSDYITLKSLNVSYKIELKKWDYYRNIIVFANAENLFTNVNYDKIPETLGYTNYPLYRMFSLGVRFQF